MIEILTTIIIFMVVLGLVFYLIGMLPIPEPFGMVIKVCAILIAILMVVGVAFGGVTMPFIRLRG